MINGDEECVLCLGTGWQEELPTVLGQNPDGTDILSNRKVSMCRCAYEVEDKEEEDEELFDEEDEEDNLLGGGILVLA